VKWEGRVFDGGWYEPRGGARDVTEPASGQTLMRAGTANAADIAAAASAAASAQPGWAATPPLERAEIFRKAAAFFHPNLPACCVGILPDVPGPTVEYQFNTARAITNLLYTGTFSRFPDVKYIFSHAGGALIPQIGRVVRHAEEDKKISERLPNGPWAEIKKLYFDTAQASNPWNLGAAKSFMPITQILLGSDYPFVQVADTVEPLLQLGLSDSELQAITRDNALRLFPRLKAA